MVVYLDVLFFFDSVIHFIFSFFIEKIYNDKVKITRIVFCSLISGILSVLALFSSFIFMTFKITLGLLLGLITFKAFSKSQKVIKISLYYLMNLGLVGLLASFRINKWYFLLIAIIILLILVMLEICKKYDIFIKRSTYNVLLVFKNIKLNLNGFLDTGNQMLVDGVPVIFVNQKYQISSDEKTFVHTQTINGEKLIPAYLPTNFIVSINKEKQIKKVYVCFVPMEKDCLLSPYIFLWGE